MRTETYTIPESRREAIKKEIARYEKKASKYGTSMNFTFGEPYAVENAIMSTDGRTETKVGTYMVEVFDLTIESEIIKKNGYTVAAKIEHLEGGNIVYAFGDEHKEEWNHCAPHCDHCKSNRFRNFTYIVKSDNDEKQVGSGCLKDYCGIDPQHIGWSEELRAYFIDNGYDPCSYKSMYKDSTVYDPMNVLAYAIKVTKKQGYITSNEIGSNRGKVEEMVSKNVEIDNMDEAKEMAEQILEILKTDRTAFGMSEMSVFLKSGYCKSSHFGTISYVPTAFAKYMEELEWKRQREEEKTAELDSEYIGQVGERIEVEIKHGRILTSWETQFGYTYLYKFLDMNDNVLVWFASSAKLKTDGLKKIKATVKDHNERDGVKQTIITRCAAV